MCAKIISSAELNLCSATRAKLLKYSRAQPRLEVCMINWLNLLFIHFETCVWLAQIKFPFIPCCGWLARRADMCESSCIRCLPDTSQNPSPFSQTSGAQNFINQSRAGPSSESENFITLDLVWVNAETFHIRRASDNTENLEESLAAWPHTHPPPGDWEKGRGTRAVLTLNLSLNKLFRPKNFQFAFYCRAVKFFIHIYAIFPFSSLPASSIR